MSSSTTDHSEQGNGLNSLINNISLSNEAINKISDAFNVSDESQYDFLEDETAKRSWYQMASHNVAVCYLTGLGVGGLYGAFEGLKANKSQYFKIRLNYLLNKVTLRGPKLGNALGVLATMYCANFWAYEKICDQFGIAKNDYVGPGVAAFCTGALYKCTTSPKSSILAGLIGIGVIGSIKVIQLIQKRMGVRGRWKSFLIV